MRHVRRALAVHCGDHGGARFEPPWLVLLGRYAHLSELPAADRYDGIEGVSVEVTLEDRGKSYGEYADGTRIAMRLFDIVQSGPSYGEMNAGQQYAMFMFCAKMARLLNGDPNHADSWLDVAGYATLVHDRI